MINRLNGERIRRDCLNGTRDNDNIRENINRTLRSI